MTFAHRLLLNYQIRFRKDHLFEGSLTTYKTVGINLKTQNKKISHDWFNNYDQFSLGWFKIPRDDACHFEIRKCSKCISKGQRSEDFRHNLANISRFPRRLQDVFKTPSIRVCNTSSWRRLERQKNVTLKMSSRHLQDIFSTSSPRRMFAGKCPVFTVYFSV